MAEPLRALLIFAAGAMGLGALFWPSAGLFWRWRRLAHRTERVLIEDALKHLHECDYRGQPATVPSLARLMGISAKRTAHLVARMKSLGLVTLQDGRLQLSSQGRLRALDVIRAHRLWERYLSEQTSLPQVEWHKRAERLEHRTAPAEAERLDRTLNRPTHDPHGDPIPTATGEIAPAKGKPLTALAAGAVGRIVHLEDEPEAIYAQLSAEQLHPGMVLRVTEVGPERVRFWAAGRERVLAPMVAANVWVVPLVEAPPIEPPPPSLWSLRPGQKGRVVKISQLCRGPERQRLLDLGLVPGTVVQVQMVSPLGDPVAYSVRGATIALRREQAELIQIAPEPTTEPTG